MRIILLHFLVFFSFVSNSLAQTTACFTAESTKGCAPFTVKLHNCSKTTVVFYNYSENKTFKAYDSTHTFTKPGKYTISQIAQNGSLLDTLILVDYIEVVPPSNNINIDVKVCSGLQITLSVNDLTDSKYGYNFAGITGGLVNPFTPVNYVFADANPKTIQVVAFNLSACVTAKDTTIIPIATVIKPDIKKLEVLNQSTNGAIALTFNAITGQRYYVQRSTNNNTGYATIDTLTSVNGQTTITYNNLNTQANTYCFRILAYDDCNPPLISEEICSIINTPVAVNNQNNISWTPHLPGNVVNYEIVKNGTLLTSISTTSYSDNAVTCGGDYCYTINGNLTGGLQSISASQCVTAISTNIPPAISNFNSTINGSSSSLTWNTPAAGVKKYYITRSQNGGAFSNYVAVDGSPYLDNNLNIPENTYCYQISYTDNCNNTSPLSSSTCPIILDVAVDANNNTQNNLFWSSYTGSWSPITYELEKLDDNGNIISSSSVGTSFNTSDIVSLSTTKVIRYRIKATGGTSETTYSNIAEITYEGAIYTPNVFTPNNDGNNDIFLAKGKFIKTFSMTIFNRWGEPVFTSKDLDVGWPGMYQGYEAQPGAYAYLIEATDLWDKNITLRGSVTLLR